jgi:SAM-dependent methyltransferase
MLFYRKEMPGAVCRLRSMSAHSPHLKLKKLLVYKILRHIRQYVEDVCLAHRALVVRSFDTVREHCQDKKFEIETEGRYLFEDELSLYSDAVVYVPTPFSRLKTIIEYIQLKPEDIFLDFGCGKGRVILYVSMHRLKKVVGIELNPELFAMAKNNLEHFKFKKTPVELVHGDAVNYSIKDENIFFFFDPFGRKTFQRVIENIRNSLTENPRAVRIVYYGPQYQNFLNEQSWLVLEKHMKKEDCMVWRSRV